MDAFLFALEAVTPIVLMVALGYFLKRVNFISADFAKVANRLVFRVFLPAMLFLNVYNISDLGSVELGYVVYVIVALLLIFAAAVPAVLAVSRRPGARGALLQAAFRSNYALIGIPLAQSLCGSAGVVAATLLMAMSIPLLNVLAVISLSVFNQDGSRPSAKKIVLEVLRNPLIQGIAAGLLALGVRAIFVQTGVQLRLSDMTPVFKVLEYLSSVATPLSLLVLGAQFEFSAVASLKREIVFGVVMRTAAVPLIGLGAAFLFFREQFTGAHFASFIAMFATPVAVSSVPMAQEMNGDVTLAGQLVVWTTLLSAISVFLATFLLRLAGIF